MNRRSFPILLWTNIKRNFLRGFFSGIGIIIGIGSLFYFVTIGNGLNNFIISREMQKLPMNMIRVRTTELSLGVFRFGQPSFMKSATISPQAVANFKKMKGVTAVYPVMNVMFPISAEISFGTLLKGRRYRRRYRTDLIMSGAPAGLVQEDIKMKGIEFNRKSWPVPVLISRHILDIYNSGFASSQDLPKLSEKALLGFRFTLVLGQSTLVRKKGVTGVRIPCRVVGFTTKSEMLGLVMPLDYTALYNKRFIRDWKQARYSSVYIKATSSDKVATIADEIEKAGYTVHAQKKVSNLILLITFMLGLFSAIIILVASISIFNAFSVIVNERRMEIGLYRSFGATKGFIRSLFLGEAAVIGSITGGIGLLLGIFFVRLTWTLIIQLLPAFFQQMGSIFPISIPLLLLMLGCSVFASILAAWLPASIAARMDISSAVRGN